MTFATLIVILGLALVGEIVYTHRQLIRAIRRPPAGPPRLPSYPSVTVIRPVKGADVDCERNFEAALDTGYPGEVETIFVFDDENDPGYPIAQRVVERHRAFGRPGRAEVCVSGPPPAGVTGKLHAMMVGQKLATGELIAFGDSDTRPDRDVLRDTVEVLLTTPGAGSAFPPVVVDGRAQKMGDVGYAMLINAWYGPSVAMAAQPAGDLPFIMGQLMVFRREALEAIGGVGCARGQLVDDMYIGSCVAQAGYRNIMTNHPLHIATGGMDLRGFVKLFKRWLLFSRNGLPASFTWPMWVRGLEFWLGTLATLIALSWGHWVAALFPLAGLVAFAASLIKLHRRFGGAPIAAEHLLLPFAIPIIAPVVVAESLVNQQVEWRGRAYTVDARARLA